MKYLKHTNISKTTLIKKITEQCVIQIKGQTTTNTALLLFFIFCGGTHGRF